MITDTSLKMMFRNFEPIWEKPRSSERCSLNSVFHSSVCTECGQDPQGRRNQNAWKHCCTGVYGLSLLLWKGLPLSHGRGKEFENTSWKTLYRTLRRKRRLFRGVTHCWPGTFRLPLPLAFLPLFLPQRVSDWESLHKTQINTDFCVELSQLEFPHAYALLPHPVSATKLTFETTWKMSHFRISFLKNNLGGGQTCNN